MDRARGGQVKAYAMPTIGGREDDTSMYLHRKAHFCRYFIIYARYFYHTLLSLETACTTSLKTFPISITSSLKCFTAFIFMELRIGSSKHCC